MKSLTLPVFSVVVVVLVMLVVAMIGFNTLSARAAIVDVCDDVCCVVVNVAKPVLISTDLAKSSSLARNCSTKQLKSSNTSHSQL
jgi:hypothetical protein